MKIVTINSMWCPACIVMHKVWNQVKDNHKDIIFENYDYDMDEEIVKSFNPGNILPVTIIINDGVEIGRLNGEKNVEDIENIISLIK